MKADKTDNELIAEFMGQPYAENVWWFLNPLREPMPHFQDLQYDTSWDWLMPVVEKINRLDDQSHLNIHGIELIRTIRKYVGTAQIKDAHMYVVEFIKWYSLNHTKP